MRRVAIAVLQLLWLFPVGAAEPPQPAAAAGYQLQPGDVLAVSVWKETELQAETLIRPDGRINFPLAGELTAAGRTVDEVRADLEARLRALVPDASVTVTLKQNAGNRIYVIGKVQRPGDFPINRPTDVMQALSLAGGGTPFADMDSIKVLRRQGSRQLAIPFHYSAVERGHNLDQNIVLQSGDTVVVP